MEIVQQGKHQLLDKIISPSFKRADFFRIQYFIHLFNRVKYIGFNDTMEEYERRKLGIFNHLIFFQLVIGILIPLSCLFNNKRFATGAWAVVCLPAVVSMLVLYLNKRHKHEAALCAYFILFPFVTCIGYMYGINLGVNLFFILFGILSVFFLKDIGYMIFSLCFSMVSYFVLSVVLKHYQYQLESINKGLYLFNQALAIVFIFYGLYLIKKENAGYQVHILDKNRDLQQKNEQIQQQSEKIKENARLFKKQAAELSELNTLKNRLFSAISHDLKAPMYALRNLFNNVQEKN